MCQKHALKLKKKAFHYRVQNHPRWVDVKSNKNYKGYRMNVKTKK